MTADHERHLVDELASRLYYWETMGVTSIPRCAHCIDSAGAPRGEIIPDLAGAPRGEIAPDSAGAPRGEIVPDLAAIRREIGDCTRCRLCAGRTNIVFGVGNPQARIMFIGEGPGAEEDAQGEPFVGRAGRLLNRIIWAMGLKREEVYIANIVKCRPPDNRAPLPEEAATCLPFLQQQVLAIHPEMIVCLGAVASRYLLEDDGLKISRVRGRLQEWRGIRVMPTYHPAFLLRNSAAKKDLWNDMQQVMKMLRLPVRK